MTSIETQQDLECARERLLRRDPESLVSFLLSLATDPGPAGDQIRTFRFVGAATNALALEL
jgi:hypothetical protein